MYHVIAVSNHNNHICKQTKEKGSIGFLSSHRDCERRETHYNLQWVIQCSDTQYLHSHTSASQPTVLSHSSFSWLLPAVSQGNALPDLSEPSLITSSTCLSQQFLQLVSSSGLLPETARRLRCEVFFRVYEICYRKRLLGENYEACYNQRLLREALCYQLWTPQELLEVHLKPPKERGYMGSHLTNSLFDLSLFRRVPATP